MPTLGRHFWLIPRFGVGLGLSRAQLALEMYTKITTDIVKQLYNLLLIHGMLLNRDGIPALSE